MFVFVSSVLCLCVNDSVRNRSFSGIWGSLMVYFFDFEWSDPVKPSRTQSGPLWQCFFHFLFFLILECIVVFGCNRAFSWAFGVFCMFSSKTFEKNRPNQHFTRKNAWKDQLWDPKEEKNSVPWMRTLENGGSWTY